MLPVCRLETQPKCIVGCRLSFYQLEGLNWLISLFDRGSGGVLVDRVASDRRVQVISLLGYLRDCRTVEGGLCEWLQTRSPSAHRSRRHRVSLETRVPRTLSQSAAHRTAGTARSTPLLQRQRTAQMARVHRHSRRGVRSASAGQRVVAVRRPRDGGGRTTTHRSLTTAQSLPTAARRRRSHRRTARLSRQLPPPRHLRSTLWNPRPLHAQSRS